MYDQDQGLKGAYHNTTLDTNLNNTSFILQARGLEASNTQESVEAIISEYRHNLTKFCLKKASTNWDTGRKRRRPPAWDPPKLLMVVVSSLHVVVGTSSVVVVVDGGV